MSEKQTEQPVEVVESFGGGAIKIEKEFDLSENREVSYVNILGVRLRRRNPDVDQLPGSSDKASNFQDLTFNEADVKLLEAALMRYSIGHHALFLSEPGFGKSTMMRFLAYLLNVPFHRVQCSHGMDVQKNFLWTAVRDNGKWKGRLGPLPQSMLDGGILLVDELPNLEPHEREIILEPTEHPNNPAIAPRAPELHIADFPGEEAVVQAKKGWFLVATGNYQEGQSAGEIHPFTEREERRVRLHALGSLPAQVKRGRLAGRYRSTATQETVLRQEVKTYHPADIAEAMPDAVIDAMAGFFTAADRIIRTEVLAQARQDPQVFLNETADRAFDHFMRFQIRTSSTSLENPMERIEEMIESAKAALEFYYVNSFREETKIKLPDALLETFQAHLKHQYPDETEWKKYLDSNKRASVREYLKWRIGMLSSERFYKERKEEGGEVRIIARHLGEQLKKIMGVGNGGLELAGTRQKIGGVQQDIIDLLNNPSAPGPLPEDAKQWCEKLLDDPEHGYDSAKDTLDVVLSSAKGESAPSKEKVKAALLKSLTKEQIAELRKLREPTLLIVPDTTAARFQEAVNKPACKTMPGQQDAVFDAFYTNALAAIAASHGVPPNQPKITKYRFVITEGRQHFDANNTDHDFEWNKRKNMKNQDRIAAFEAYIQSHPGLVSQNAAMYMMLMIRGLKGGNPTDKISDTDWQFTLLPGEPKTVHVKDGLVASGVFYSVNRQACFGFVNLVLGYAYARLRAAVMGEIA